MSEKKADCLLPNPHPSRLVPYVGTDLQIRQIRQIRQIGSPDHDLSRDVLRPKLQIIITTAQAVQLSSRLVRLL